MLVTQEMVWYDNLGFTLSVVSALYYSVVLLMGIPSPNCLSSSFESPDSSISSSYLKEPFLYC